MAKSNHYINSEEFTQVITDYINDCKNKEQAGLTIPRVPDKIGSMIHLIATNMSKKSWFNGYTYREDMVMDGTIACLKCIRNFNPSFGSTAFSYFSRVIYFAFRQRIIKENKQRTIKESMITNYFYGSDDENDLLYNESAKSTDISNQNEYNVLSTYYFKETEKTDKT